MAYENLVCAPPFPAFPRIRSSPALEARFRIQGLNDRERAELGKNHRQERDEYHAKNRRFGR
jgi:hypothetical protein